MKKVIIFASMFIFLASQAFSEEARILRYPNASDTHIAFCHGGDIFTAPLDGGLARRLTTSDGIEMYPRFSADGKTLAFTGEYDGNREIYIMPSEGGFPERLTYSMDIGTMPERMGPDKIIMQWTTDKKILYRSRKQSWNVLVGQLFEIGEGGGLPEEIPLPKSGFAYLSPDGKKIAYNRIFREYRTWKRYRGGQADDIWIYNFQTKEIENISDNPAQDIIPMWYKDKVYYLSDRDHYLNLFVYDTKTKQTKKVTDFKKFDVKFPSLGSKYIAFQNGGYIYLLDPETDKYNKVEVEIAEDFPQARTSIEKVKGKISSFEISPKGERAMFTARGDVFTVPAEKGKTYNLTKSSGAHDRYAVFSPDGKWIAYVSDKSGEDEIYIMKPDGSDEKQLTDNAESYRYGLKWSPDSKKILTSDKTMKLYFIDIDSKKITQVCKSKVWEIRDYTWSPDSKWIAYTDFIGGFNPVVKLYSLENEKTHDVTDLFFRSANPEFSADGKYLFFVSDRTFSGQSGTFEYNYIFKNMSKIYGLTLQKSTESPFAKFENDEVVPEEEKKDDAKKDEKTKKKSEDLKIEIDGIKDRIFELPVSAGNYGGLKSTKAGKLYYVKSDGSSGFYAFDFDKKDEKKVGSFRGYEISADEKKIIFKSGGDYYIENMASDIIPGKGKLNLQEMTVELDRKAEWRQIFDEAWRQMKYFFYDPNMHGVDWDAVYKRYSQLASHVVHRNDLTYVIGEMIGELSVGHAYVGGGDMPKVKKVPIGLLGAEFELDGNSGFYKITKIFEGRNWEEKTRSPLTEPGLDINEGDYIIAIDGEKLTKQNTPYVALVNKAREFVTLKINSKPSEKGAREVNVKTIANESVLRYFNWVENNRRKVEEATNGKVGYIHIPDMGYSNGLNEFVKYFYPQARKEALIIDDRYNGGGNVSPLIIERLRRILAVAKHARNQEVVMTNPGAVMTGPIVCLINQQSMSDGDLFPYQFKNLGLGKLIGKRTWGGVIGIRGSLPFLDGGNLYKPEFANFGADGKWILEGVGMVPDIEVENHPAKEYNGVDEQLNKAIEVILEEIKTDKKPKIPVVPPFPDKSK